MSILTSLSKSIGEIDLMQESHIRYFEDDMLILSCGNFGDDHLHYIMVYQRSTDTLCRLNMLKPEYIGYADEHLILDKDNILKLISILKYKGDWENGCVNNMSIWASIIYHTIEFYEMSGNKEYFYVPLPKNLPIPDYIKLL